MLEFYRAYFLPASSTRAKLAIHLIAQVSAEAVAAKSDSAEQTIKIDTVPEPNEATETNGDSSVNGHAESKKAKKTVLIEDVPAFKASMSLSAGVRPAKDVSEFEELEPKL